jgi:hypothetical protein
MPPTATIPAGYRLMGALSSMQQSAALLFSFPTHRLIF